jgi:hypothetical protein
LHLNENKVAPATRAEAYAPNTLACTLREVLPPGEISLKFW